MRKTYVQNSKGKFVLRDPFIRQDRVNAPMIMDALKEFKSPIDGQIITSRNQLASHNKQHGVTDSRDYNGGYIERKAKERIDSGQKELKRTRIEDLNNAFDKHSH